MWDYLFTYKQDVPPSLTPPDNLPCAAGAIVGYDANYLYVCAATNTVKRIALSTY